MRSLLPKFILPLASLAIMPQATAAAEPKTSLPATVERHQDNIRVPMRDGVSLSTNLFLPEGKGPFPVMFIRTPYDASIIKKEQAAEWTQFGYAVVYQDTRGRFRSEGVDIPWRGEKEDAEDAINWIIKQPWSNGKVGMYGGSYLAFTQVAAARSGHPALKVVAPTIIGADRYAFHYWGGALRHGRINRWLLRATGDFDQSKLENHLPLKTADFLVSGKEIPYWREMIAHPTYDDYWKTDTLSEEIANVQAPAFIRTGWFDLFFSDAFNLYHAFREKAASQKAREQTRIIVGPWPHDINQTHFCDVDFGTKGKIPDLFQKEVQYMGHFLKDEEAPASEAPIRLYIMGANEWRDEQEWPLARTQWTKFHLASDGKANTAEGDGKLTDKASGKADQFDYDPANPVPTAGGSWCFNNLGLKDRREVEARNDVLVYTSEPLKEATEVTGPIKAELYVSSSAPDTDFTVRLVDVAPDGKTLGVTDGIVRARYRNQKPEGEFLKPGEVYKVTVECVPTAYQFAAGHRIRVQISSSNFPVFSRNLNTGDPIDEEVTPVVAHQTIHHSEDYPSHITLPIIPARK